MLLWLNLSWRAKVLGIAWMVVGLAYGAYNTQGFKRELVNFEIPSADGQDDAICNQ